MEQHHPGIVRNFDQATMDAEAARAMREHPDSLDKRDLMLRKATSLAQRSKAEPSGEDRANERALALDPNYVWALRDAARKSCESSCSTASRPTATPIWRARRRRWTGRFSSQPNDVEVLRTKAIVLRARGDLDEAAALLRRVIELAPAVGRGHVAISARSC